MPMVTKNGLTMGEVAARSGFAVSASHFYERQGLIENWRTSGNQRRYYRDVLRRLAVTGAGQRVGLPLAIIKEAFESLPKERALTAEDWACFSAKWHAELNARIARLTVLRDNLGKCIGCGCLSLEFCPIYNADDIAGENGPARIISKPGPYTIDLSTVLASRRSGSIRPGGILEMELGRAPAVPIVDLHAARDPQAA